MKNKNLKSIFSRIFLIIFLFNFAFVNFAPVIFALGGPNPEVVKAAQELTKKQQTCSERGLVFDSSLPLPDQCRDKNADESSGCLPSISWSEGISGFNLTNCVVYMANWLFATILSWINSFLFLILSIASYILDLAVYTTVVQFRSNFSELSLNADIGIASVGIGGILGIDNNSLIYYLWSMLRDFLNILILVMVIYTAVLTMFNGLSESRKTFITLLVFSIIANFSLLMIKFSIDISNILALQAYTLSVQPQSTDSFNNFRTRADRVDADGQIDTSPANLGEFIMNNIGISKFFETNKASDIATEQITKDQNSFVFQLGMMGVIITLIYLFLYIAVILFMRAFAFVLAMVLAALLAADFFFSYFKSDAGETVVGMVKSITESIKNDYLDALIKGPALLFAVFMIGVLANAIFTQALSQTIEGSIASSGFANSTQAPAFSTALFTFFKFAFFAMLCKVVFDKLNDIKFSKTIQSGNGKWFGKASNAGVNFLLRNSVGRVAQVGGFAGRRIIGQGFADGRIGKTLGNTFSNMAKSETVFGRLIGNSVGNAGIGVLKNLKGASYDLRNSKTLEKTVGSLGFKVKDTLGEGEKRSFGAINEEVSQKAKDRRKEYVQTAKEGISLTKDEKEDIEKQTKVAFAGGKYNAKEIEAALEEYKKNPNANIKIGSTADNIKEISAEDASKYFKKDPSTRISEAEGAIASQNAEVESKVEKKLKDNKEKFEKEIKAQIAAGSGPRFLSETADSLPLANKILGRDVRGDISSTQTLEFVKKGKEKGKNQAKVLNIIDGKVDSSISSLKSFFQSQEATLAEEVKTSMKKDIENLKKYDEIFSELNKNRFSADTEKVAILQKKLKEYDDLHNGLFDSAENIISRLTVLNRGENFDAKKLATLSAIRKSIDSSKKAYDDTKPKKDGEADKHKGEKKEEAKSDKDKH